MNNNHFVDRNEEISQFYDFIENKDGCLLLNFHGPSGIGKSWLAKRIMTSCKKENYYLLLIDFKLDKDCDYLKFITDIRDKVQLPAFDEISKVIGKWIDQFKTIYIEKPKTDETDVDFGKENTFSGTFSNLSIGGDVINLTVQMPDKIINNLAYQMKNNLTEVLIHALSQLEDKNQIIVILDAYEYASSTFSSWLLEKFLPQLCEVNSACLHIAVCGQEPINPPDYYKRIFDFKELLPFKKEDVEEYLFDIRKLSEFDSETIFGLSQGHPSSLGFIADTLENYAKTRLSTQ